MMSILPASLCLALMSALFVFVPVMAQQPLAFDVVSIKRTSPGTTGGGFRNPQGQFIAINIAIRS